MDLASSIWGNDHEIEFHENKSFFFRRLKDQPQDQKFFFRRLKDQSWDQKLFFSGVKSFNKILQFQSGDWQFDNEIKKLKRIIRDFQSDDRFVSCKCDHEIKSLKSIISTFQSHEQFASPKYNHEIESI